jgi:hypothetical protein
MRPAPMAPTSSIARKRRSISASPNSAPGRGDTVAVDIAHADKDTIQTACTKGFPRPKEIFGELGPGEAYVPPGHEKKARFVIDLTTSKAVPEGEFSKQ